MRYVTMASIFCPIKEFLQNFVLLHHTKGIRPLYFLCSWFLRSPLPLLHRDINLALLELQVYPIPALTIRNVDAALADFTGHVIVFMTGLVEERKYFVFWAYDAINFFFFCWYHRCLLTPTSWQFSCQQKDVQRMHQENTYIQFGKLGSRIGLHMTVPSFFLFGHQFFKEQKLLEIGTFKLYVKTGKVGSLCATVCGIFLACQGYRGRLNKSFLTYTFFFFLKWRQAYTH